MTIHGVYPPHADPATRPLELYVDRALPSVPGLRLGLFVPNESWAEFPTLAPTSTEWTYEYNKTVVRKAEEIGFSFVFPAGRWKGLQGDDLNWRGASLDTITLTAALLEATDRIVCLTTIHTNVFNPVVAAKFGADMDQIGRGRWGMNIVSGWGVHEFEQMGVPLLNHKDRYAYTREWLDIVRGLWADGEFSFEGTYFQIHEATVWPRPAQRPRPLLVNAGQSYTGMRFSAEQVDYVFSYPARVADFAKICQEVGRQVGFIGTKRILVADTDAEATDLARDISRQLDHGAVRAHMIAAGAATTDTIHDLLKTDADYDNFLLEDAIIGGPDTVAKELTEWVLEYRPSGVCLLFYNCLQDLTYFGDHVLPQLTQRLQTANYPLTLN